MGNRGFKRRSASDGRDDQNEKNTTTTSKPKFAGLNPWMKPRSQSPKRSDNERNNLNIFLAPKFKISSSSRRNSIKSEESQENQSPSLDNFEFKNIINTESKKSPMDSPDIRRIGTIYVDETDQSKKIKKNFEENQENLQYELKKLKTIYSAKQEKIIPDHQISPLLNRYKGKRPNEKKFTAAEKRKELVLKTLKTNTNVFDLKLDKKDVEPHLISKATDAFIKVNRYFSN